MQKKDLKIGHRKRLREKFLISPESLNDYELLEMVLFASNARKDTRTLAKEIIDHYGNLTNVFESNINDLKDFNNIGMSNAVSIKCIKELFNRFLKNKIDKKIVKLNSIEKIENYCISAIGNEIIEKIKVLFLNSKLELKKEEFLGSGNATEVKLYKNILVSKATQYSCHNIILVHNHPSGDPNPSIGDIDLTLNLQELLKMLDMKLIDHIIVSNNSSFSMSKNGLLIKENAIKYKQKIMFRNR